VNEPKRHPVWHELDDATLLGHLRRALHDREPPPARVVALAKASFGLRDLDADLAALVADSSQDAVGPRVRSVRAPRMLSFEAGELAVEVEMAPAAEGWRLVGQLDPPGPARVELRRPTGPHITVDADQRGRFTLDVADPGPVSLRCYRTGQPAIVTAWVLLS
jgi:hypothetical protein